MNKQNAALLSVVSNSVLIAIKLLAGILMHSVGVISEAIHSSIDLIASLIAFFSIRVAVKPADEDHPFGHSKYENVSGFVEAILIFFAAILIIYEAVRRIITGTYVENLGMGIIVMLFASFVNGVVSYFLFKVSKEENSIALKADAMHLLTDVFTSLGVTLGLVAIKVTKLDILDPIIAIFVALLIIKASIELTKEALKDLTDTSLPEEEVKEIENIIKSNSEITSFHKLRTRKSGPRREIDVHLRVDRNYNIVDAHELSHKVSKQITDKFPDSHVIIHVEPERKKEEDK
ncbi:MULTISPECIES: cation diffusion facilitator family transporter [Thermoanaerobacter]|uniref:Cation diffusion facilitator family transporter n=2 Tax=Thermoanaerobacter TaxID=1754 RepID=I9AE70_9THEO|nr:MULTISPECIES: cation diffusion facilitator family transporter [Thermoanaerobacter]AEM77625.1 cation diffusion facilitator family transporter [Thermoanaerobacter wiegelii Rt8.B1]EGD52999.1 cation diffusion facilitator family transporter [Thermoanaerobacter ethanolicus JW 200]EIW00322.1 cation diffusion facilitator family transporter [Thermoanaerobacter siderophilus SR4]HHY80650.1 cation transporter [Thermoanaerobacter sp.]